ncbi:hypothetical protein FF38_13581 [Lucilia cuprina]|uniref:Uncharacterized protein n=1 Tax=Lucilia cuprina TaxID=7375 RepID=A0A0L0BQZ5_LUCCU|nr:hypothetical protein CVS40_6399 [Lucilia cuprina]KNC22457.1 hypothetical protein FF38_13581 [Lucilia cuprina]
MSLQRKFVDNLATHENNLMNEIFEMERNVDWSGVTYLSPIGILGAPGTNGLDARVIPEFYARTSPGSHRG